MKGKTLNKQQLEMATLYAMGALDQNEEKDFRICVQTSAELRTEVESFHAVIEALGDQVPQVSPPAHLRQRLMAAIASPTSTTTVPKTPSVTTVKSAELPWKSMGYPGVSFKPLNIDLELGRITMLLKLDAGHFFPPHQHLQREENLVLEGDLVGETYCLGPGDYMLGQEGSHHGVFSSVQGCVVLVMAAISDNVLALAMA